MSVLPTADLSSETSWSLEVDSSSLLQAATIFDVMKRKTSKSNSADVVVRMTARYTQLKLSFDFNVDKKKDVGGEAGDGVNLRVLMMG